MLKNKDKFTEFLTLFIMVVGSVVGSGIFMKNKELLNETGNPIISIILWIFVGIICVLTVYVFVQIGSSTRNLGNGTNSNWIKLFVGRKVASFCSIFYFFLYYPICQAVFVSGFISYFFRLMNKPLTLEFQLILFSVIGISLILIFGLLNSFSQISSRKIQIFGTIFKFIPLFIALFAGFFLIDKTNGTSAIWNGVGIGEPKNGWSSTEFKPILFFRGFGAILFAFDQFVCICNAQKTAKHKSVVPKALLFGMIFVALFYSLMAISLFLGSPDGSVVELLNKIFRKNKNLSRIISNVTLMLICLIGINTFSYLATIDLESNVFAKLIYSKKNKPLTYKKAGIMQLIPSIFIYIIFIFAGTFIVRMNWNGINSTASDFLTTSSWIENSCNYISGFIGTMSSAVSIFSFLIIVIIMISAFVNEYTHKVNVVKIKGFKPITIICSYFLFIFVIAGLMSFIIPIEVYYGKINWFNSNGFYFLIFLFIGFSIIFIGFFIQEIIFKKYPLVDGFYGYLSTNKVENIEVKIE